MPFVLHLVEVAKSPSSQHVYRHISAMRTFLSADLRKVIQLVMVEGQRMLELMLGACAFTPCHYVHDFPASFPASLLRLARLVAATRQVTASNRITYQLKWAEARTQSVAIGCME